MKFVYLDESGSDDSPYISIFGFQVDAYRLKSVMQQAADLFADIEEAYPESLRELKSSRLVNGKGAWRRVDPEDRKELFRRLCGFAEDVSCRAYAYILSTTYYNNYRDDAPDWALNPWCAAAIPVVLTIQERNQRQRNNKGLSVVVFDDNQRELPKLSTFLADSCESADEFYGRGNSADPFDHVVDTSFAIRSEHSTLVQISDACAFAIRRLAELDLHHAETMWESEADYYRECVALFSNRVVFTPRIWTTNPFCDDAVWIRDASHTDFCNWVREA